MDSLVQGNNRFALELYGRLGGEAGNLFLSPASISTVLAMTYAGARTETAAEMARVLRFGLPPERLHPAFAAMREDLRSAADSSGAELRIANALWGQKGHAFLPDFLALARDGYGAGLDAVDFTGATEAARRTINAWVARETSDKIQELFEPGVLTADARLVLTNAIYFKGFWARQFSAKLTREAPFHATAKRDVAVPMMGQTATFGYLDGGDFQALELPYRGDALSMVVLLPKAVDGLAALEKKLAPSALDDWMRRMDPKEVETALPRFKVTAGIQLDRTLAELGMRRAFSRATADFSGMTGQRDLFISAVVHKAFVDVNEEGTEAAAATGVGMALTAMEAPAPVFRADHPFVFVIRHSRTGAILFLGRIVDPTR